jgi:hypothetical protein
MKANRTKEKINNSLKINISLENKSTILLKYKLEIVSKYYPSDPG